MNKAENNQLVEVSDSYLNLKNSTMQQIENSRAATINIDENIKEENRRPILNKKGGIVVTRQKSE